MRIPPSRSTFTATLLLLALPLLLPACRKAPPPSPGISASDGTATILSVNAPLWEARLQTPDGPRRAYWTQYTIFYRGNSVLSDYAPRPGTTIGYKGIVTGHEIFLTRIWILKD